MNAIAGAKGDALAEATRSTPASPSIGATSGSSAKPPALAVRQLAVRYGGVQALAGIDLTVPAGEVVAIIGPNGAGKSTLFNAISGLAGPAVRGQTLVNGQAARPSRRRLLAVTGAAIAVGLLAATLVANPERLWADAVNETFRLHCAGSDTRGCKVPWHEVAEAGQRSFAGQSVLHCADMGPEGCGRVLVRAADGIDHSWATVAEARASLPALDATPTAQAQRARCLWQRLAVACLAGAASAAVLLRQARQAARSATAACRRGIARTFQNIRIFAHLDVLANVQVAQGRGRRWWSHDAAARSEALRLLAEVGLKDVAHVRAGTLAYGQLRRLEIARALATGPSVLLLDEPAAGMNGQESQTLLALVAALRARGLAVLLIEHDMELVMGVADKVVVLDYGRKIAEGRPEEVRRNPQVIAAYLGTAGDAAAPAAEQAVGEGEVAC